MLLLCFFLFFFNDTATTEIYTLSLHDALPIYQEAIGNEWHIAPRVKPPSHKFLPARIGKSSGLHSKQGLNLSVRSEEHTSELQSRLHLVCRLLLEKKKNQSRFI